MFHILNLEQIEGKKVTLHPEVSGLFIFSQDPGSQLFQIQQPKIFGIFF